MTLLGSFGGCQRRNGVDFKMNGKVRVQNATDKQDSEEAGKNIYIGEGKLLLRSTLVAARPLCKAEMGTSPVPGHTPRSLRTTECILTDPRPGALGWNRAAPTLIQVPFPALDFPSPTLLPPLAPLPPHLPNSPLLPGILEDQEAKLWGAVGRC